MPSQVTPEARALLIVFIVVLASVALQTMSQAFVRIESADNMARESIDAAQEARDKGDDLETQVDELRNELQEARDKGDDLETQVDELRNELEERR
jgi:peptidoglycan hydrolase CwlO-like protein